MKPPTNDPEERLEAWLASRPLMPPPDFVARTLARIRTEAVLMAAARAGDEAAIDALLDSWLGEQTLEPEFEPDQLVTSTRRAATREEQEEGRLTGSGSRRVILFPIWARAATALSAAACVALIGYLSLRGPAGNTMPKGNSNMATNSSSETSGDTFQPAHYAWNSDPKYILDFSDSVKDLAPVANADDPDEITRELGNDDTVN